MYRTHRRGDTANIIVQPVVVTSGVLCRAYLDRAGDLQVERVRHAELTVRQGEATGLTRCLVVTEDYVDTLMAHAAKTAEFYGSL